MHFRALTRKRFLYFRRDVRGLLCEIFIPIIVVWIGFFITTIQVIKPADGASYTPTLFGMPDNVIWVNSGFEQYTSRIPTINTTVVAKDYPTLQSFDEALVANKEPKRLMSIFLEGVNPGTHIYNYALFMNTTAPDTLHIG